MVFVHDEQPRVGVEYARAASYDGHHHFYGGGVGVCDEARIGHTVFLFSKNTINFLFGHKKSAMLVCIAPDGSPYNLMKSDASKVWERAVLCKIISTFFLEVVAVPLAMLVYGTRF